MDAELRAIADPTRREILRRLGCEEATAGEIASGFRITRPAVSQHLRVLLEARLLRVRRNGTRRLYSVDPITLRRIRLRLDELLGARP